jgi:hypothetical protein
MGRRDRDGAIDLQGEYDGFEKIVQVNQPVGDV